MQCIQTHTAQKSWSSFHSEAFLYLRWILRKCSNWCFDNWAHSLLISSDIHFFLSKQLLFLNKCHVTRHKNTTKANALIQFSDSKIQLVSLLKVFDWDRIFDMGEF